MHYNSIKTQLNTYNIVYGSTTFVVTFTSHKERIKSTFVTHKETIIFLDKEIIIFLDYKNYPNFIDIILFHNLIIRKLLTLIY